MELQILVFKNGQVQEQNKIYIWSLKKYFIFTEKFFLPFLQNLAVLLVILHKQ